MIADLSSISTNSLHNIDQFHSIVPLCPLCNKDIIQIEKFTRTPCNDEPKIEFSCSCLKKKNLPNSSVPIKEYMLFLQGRNNTIPTCFKHKDNNGMYYCLTCQLYMCQSCFEYHNVFEPSHLTQYAQEINNILCGQHINSNCDSFCSECNVYICKMCKESSHRNHNVKTFQDIWEDIYKELDDNTSEELKVRWEKQKYRMHLYIEQQNKAISSRIKRLEYVRNQLNDMYRKISYENELYLQFYKMILNNFLCSKLSPKISLMHNITKMNYSIDNILLESTIININIKNENIGNSIIDYKNSLIDSLNQMKIIKAKQVEGNEFLPPVNCNNFQQQSLTFQVNPTIYTSPKESKLSLYKENSFTSIGSVKLLGSKREKSTSDTSSICNPNIKEEVMSVQSENCSTKSYYSHGISQSIPVSVVSIQNSGENIYNNVQSNRNYDTKSSTKKQIVLNILKGQNIKKRYSQCIRTIVNEHLISKAISIYKIVSDYFLLTASDNNTIKLYKLTSQNIIKEISTSPSQVLNFSSFLISSYECLCSFDNHSIKIFNLKTLEFSPVEFKGHTQLITEFVSFVNKTYFATSSKDKTIIIWKSTIEGWKRVLKGHKKGVLSLVLSDNKLVSGGADTLINIWDVQKEICSGTLYGHTGSVLCLNKSENNPYVISASNDNTVRIWDIDNLKCISSYGEDNLNITTVVWVTNDIIAGGNSTGGLYLFTWNDDFDCYEIKEMAHKKEIARVISYDNGKFIVSSSEDKTIKFWMN